MKNALMLCIYVYYKSVVLSTYSQTLNALYMDAITSIMASEFAVDLDKFNIQIHNVRIQKDLKTVIVYWSCDESGLVDEEAKAALENIETPVRSRLRSIR